MFICDAFGTSEFETMEFAMLVEASEFGNHGIYDGFGNSERDHGICDAFGNSEFGTMVFAMLLEPANSGTMVFAMVLEPATKLLAMVFKTANSETIAFAMVFGSMVFAMLLETANLGTMVFAMLLETANSGICDALETAHSGTMEFATLLEQRSRGPWYLRCFWNQRIRGPCYLRWFWSQPRKLLAMVLEAPGVPGVLCVCTTKVDFPATEAERVRGVLRLKNKTSTFQPRRKLNNQEICDVFACPALEHHVILRNH